MVTVARFTSTSSLATRKRTTSKYPFPAACQSAVRPSPSVLLTLTLSTSDSTVLILPFLAALIKSDSLIFAMDNYRSKINQVVTRKESDMFELQLCCTIINWTLPAADGLITFCFEFCGGFAVVQKKESVFSTISTR